MVLKFLYFSLIIILISCNALLESPGTLGVSTTHDFNCSASEIDYALSNLSDIQQFKIKGADTVNVQWWKEGGYDFLNYRCIRIKKRLFMLTLDGGAIESNLSIRSYYNRKKEEWIFASDFTQKEHYYSDQAFEYLLNYLPSCE